MVKRVKGTFCYYYINMRKVFIVTNTFYPSIEKQKVKINGSMVRRKGLFDMV